MYKGKVSSKLSKCIKVTGTGKLIRKLCGKNHKLNKKRNSRKRKLSKKTILNKTFRKSVRKSLNM